MCDLFGGNSSNPDASAAAAAQAQISAQQAQTNSNITQGQNNIDSAFAQFTPDYYSGVTQAYENAEDPALANQYSIAQDQLTAQLAGTGMGQSSVGNNAQAQLELTNANNQAQIADAGANAANTLKTTVNNTEDNLSAMNAAAANPSLAATDADAQSAALVAPQAYPSLSNVFASVLSPIASAGKAASGTMNLTPGTPYPQPTTPTSGAGSGIFS
jgi:hypothetical protein